MEHQNTLAKLWIQHLCIGLLLAHIECMRVCSHLYRIFFFKLRKRSNSIVQHIANITKVTQNLSDFHLAAM